MMIYLRIENALETCKLHIRSLDQTDIKFKELETYLVGGLVVLIVSEYEDYLESVFVRRAERCGDPHAINYIKKSLSQKFRSPDMGKITEILKLFDTTYCEYFRSEISNSPEHAAWDSLMKARHAVVHKKGTLNLTFGELLENYDKTKKVIHAVESSLGVAS
ncbi:hypothetical protein O1C66_003625 [Vibrio cholerae]|nr:hypothetical protein [Vibrio cholerae]